MADHISITGAGTGISVLQGHRPRTHDFGRCPPRGVRYWIELKMGIRPQKYRHGGGWQRYNRVAGFGRTIQGEILANSSDMDRNGIRRNANSMSLATMLAMVLILALTGCNTSMQKPPSSSSSSGSSSGSSGSSGGSPSSSPAGQQSGGQQGSGQQSGGQQSAGSAGGSQAGSSGADGAGSAAGGMEAGQSGAATGARMSRP